jgi:hypothetical protein
VFGWALSPVTAEASPPRTSSLSWVRLPGADSCVATQDLAKDVEKLLERGVFVSAASADVSVEGRIEPKPRGGFHAAISIRDEKGALLGTRELEGAGACSLMREELALVIAVMIDPDAIGRPAPPAPTPAPAPALAPAPTSAPAPAPTPAPAPAPAPKPRWHLDAGASLAGEVGLLPHPSLGVRVDALLTPPRFMPLEGYGALWPHDSASAGATNASFTVALVGGGLCPLHFLGDRVHLYGCASGIAGLVWEEGNGSPNGPSVLLSAELEARLSLRLGGPFVARLGLAAMVNILRPSYGLGPSSETSLYQMSVIAGTADLGLGFVF